jgi:hypothetical protein
MGPVCPPGELHAGLADLNSGLTRYNSLHWEKKAMAEAPGDVTRATLTHWPATRRPTACRPGRWRGRSRTASSARWIPPDAKVLSVCGMEGRVLPRRARQASSYGRRVDEARVPGRDCCSIANCAKCDRGEPTGRRAVAAHCPARFKPLGAFQNSCKACPLSGCQWSSAVIRRPRCNGVQGATATTAFTAMAVTWFL